jgi:bacterioferritin-associated ferredoxin
MLIGNLALVIVAAAVAGVVVTLLRVARRRPAGKACARCGNPSSHGYSKSAESNPEDIVPLCTPCLLRRLDEDYCTYDGYAVVVQPVAELPCYVFRPKSDWGANVSADVDFVLAARQSHCATCGHESRYVWVNALEAGPVAKIPELGIRRTLLTASATHPMSLCARCTVERLSHSLTALEAGYVEICGPHGKEDGLVTTIGS